MTTNTRQRIAVALLSLSAAGCLQASTRSMEAAALSSLSAPFLGVDSDCPTGIAASLFLLLDPSGMHVQNVHHVYGGYKILLVVQVLHPMLCPSRADQKRMHRMPKPNHVTHNLHLVLLWCV